MITPPGSEAELRNRAASLAGRTIEAIADAMGVSPPPRGVRGKGKIGGLIETALGADSGNAARPDFGGLGIELKTLPLRRGVPRESTFVCTIALADADRAEWETSVARAKLAHVLFVPIVFGAEESDGERRVGTPFFWQPTPSQEAVLKGDFDEVMGLIGAGGIEALNARRGRWLQVRPKAATGAVRTISFGPEGEWIATVPRGFYLRASFTRALLGDPGAMPG